MDDPKRWIDDDADDAERALLREARSAHDPSPGRREAVLAAVLAEVGGSGGGGSSSSGGSTTTLKIGGAIVLGALVAWLFLGRKHETPVPIEHPATSASVAPTTAPSASTAEAPAPSSVEPPTPIVQAPAVAKPSLEVPLPRVAPSASASSSYSSRLREESELIAHARQSLRDGKYTEAQSFLDTAQTKFPNGVLGQERKALAIEILFRSGRRAEGEAMAQDFLATYPNSPHAAKIRELQKP